MYRKDKGGIIIEFIFVINLFFVVGLAGYELTRALKFKKVSMSLSRELANVFFRECADALDITRTQCMVTYFNQINNFASSLDAELYITVVNTNPNSANTILVRKHCSHNVNPDYTAIMSTSTPGVCDDNPPSGTDGSKFRSISPGDSIGNFVLNNSSGHESADTIIIAESYVKYNPTLKVIAELIGLQDGYYYDVAIM